MSQFGPSFPACGQVGRACVCRDGSTHSLPTMHSSPLAFPAHGVDGMPGSAKGSVSVLHEAGL